VKRNPAAVYHAVTREWQPVILLKRCIVIVGIAHPENILSFLTTFLEEVTPIILADHQACPIALLKEAQEQAPVILTEKDWIKIKDQLTPLDRVWVLPLQLVVDSRIKERLLDFRRR
jgi:tetraacyldisaccharide-1-P 4'-kinase